MNPWDFGLNLKDFILDVTALGAFLVAGTIMRRYIPFFQKYLVPNNIIGGFLGLILSQQIVGLIKIDGDRLGQYVYHLLALTFIVIGLGKSKTKFGKGPVSKCFIELTCYITQAAIGLLVMLILIYTLFPDLPAAMGLLVPLGFGMGPGIAYTMGHSWEKLGLEGGGMIGLTFAAIGFLIAYFAGVAIVNRGIKNRETALIKGPESLNNDIRTGIVKENKPEVAGWLTLSPEAIEPMAFQMGLIGLIYALTYGLITILTNLMKNHGLGDFVDTIWSFHFVIGLLIAVLVRKILDLTNKSYVIDTGLMNRISGVAVDFMVTGSIVAINLVIVGKYWLPITLISIVAGLLTYFIIRFASQRAFDDYNFERMIGIFGEMTGTINSGLVLIRITDPEFKTPAAEDLAYGGGMALFLGFPLLILLNAPMNFWNNSLPGYWLTLGLMLVYLIILWIVWFFIGYIRLKPPYKS
jgi:ESS family glutamate:Na+ symporter